jgi:DNA-directed RNA polymerase subunit RPC12/RpoP
MDWFEEDLPEMDLHLCPTCGHHIDLFSFQVGLTFRCDNCGQPITVEGTNKNKTVRTWPTPEEVIDFNQSGVGYVQISGVE